MAPERFSIFLAGIKMGQRFHVFRGQRFHGISHEFVGQLHSGILVAPDFIFQELDGLAGNARRFRIRLFAIAGVTVATSCLVQGLAALDQFGSGFIAKGRPLLPGIVPCKRSSLIGIVFFS